MTCSFGVVADDFTGACDAGVQFKKCGLETVVLTRTGSLGKVKVVFDVVVVDAESRNVTSRAAYRKVRRALKALKGVGVELVYKKIDSTLRGNIGAELDAVMDVLGVKAVIVAPAFPACKRTTVNGRVLVDNVPLDRTEFARDIFNSLNESDIATLIGRQTDRRIGHVDLSKVRSGVNSSKNEIQKLMKDGIQIVVADAETQNDLANIARASVGSDVLPCGSAGLAMEVSRLLSSKLSLLVVSGSVNSVTLSQIATAEREINVKVLEPDISGVLTSGEKEKVAVKNLVSEAEEALAEGRDVILRLAESKDVVFEVQKIGETRGMRRVQVYEKLLSVLAEASRKIADDRKFAGLILIGGDTSIKVMGAMGAKGIKIEREVLPGVPLGRILGGEHEGMCVITKAGGFGDSYTLVKLIKCLRGEDVG